MSERNREAIKEIDTRLAQIRQDQGYLLDDPPAHILTDPMKAIMQIEATTRVEELERLRAILAEEAGDERATR